MQAPLPSVCLSVSLFARFPRSRINFKCEEKTPLKSGVDAKARCLTLTPRVPLHKAELPRAQQTIVQGVCVLHWPLHMYSDQSDRPTCAIGPVPMALALKKPLCTRLRKTAANSLCQYEMSVCPPLLPPRTLRRSLGFKSVTVKPLSKLSDKGRHEMIN